jgi:hypothetical protein
VTYNTVHLPENCKEDLIDTGKCFHRRMISFPKRVVVFVAVLITMSCANKHRSTIIGDWSGENVTITKGNETITVPIDKYGYLKLSLNRDSTYIMSLAVLKDVRVEKDIFGMTANRVLIPAIYKSTRFGKWTRVDSGFNLSSQQGVISAVPSPDGEDLTLHFTDADGRAWLATLEPKE